VTKIQHLPLVDLDNVNHRRRQREVTNSILRFEHDDSRVQTSAEKLAGVTPVNYAYPPGDVRRYGVKGDGTDEADKLQAAINQAAQTGGSDVYIPKGIITVGSPIQLLDNVCIRGAGKQLTSIRALAGSGDDVSTLLYASGVDGWELADLTLNGNLANITPTSSHLTLFVSGCSNWRVTNVHSTDAGRTAASPLGQHFIISVSEPGENATGAAYDVDDLPCFNWVVSGCSFSDTTYKCEFGIRVYSEFTLALADNAFTVFNSGIIENCFFDGFMWNPIELAGPAVRHTTISSCYSKNSQTYGAFEIDKGASFNKVIGCVVEDVDMVKTDQCAYRCQGYPTDGTAPTRYALGNQFIGCSVRGMDGDNTNYPVGIWVNLARRTSIIGFDAEDLLDTSSTNFAPVVRVDDAYDTTIIGGTWTNVVGGVYLGPNTTSSALDGLSVTGVNSNTLYRFYLTSGSSTRTRVRFSGNEIRVHDQIAFSISNSEEISIVDNHLLSDGGGSGNTGCNISSSAGRTHVFGNTFHDFNAGVDYSGGSAINVIVRGNTFHSCTTNVSGSNAVRNCQSENYATDAGGVARTMTFGTAAPGAGTWFVGDVVWHSAPAASGNIGWVCTTGGTPGTWKTFGAIAA
jgi:hypothetical protein